MGVFCDALFFCPRTITVDDITDMSWDTGRVFRGFCRHLELNFHDFSFFFLKELIDLVLEIFYKVVNVFVCTTSDIFRKFEFFDVLLGVLTDGAETDFCFLDFFGGLLGDLATAFFGKRWNWNTDYAAVVAGVEPESLISADCGRDIGDITWVERCNEDHLSLWRSDVGGLVKWEESAVDFDFYRVEHRWVGATGADFV